MKSRNWTDDPEIDELLNSGTANTGEMAKFDRIMQHRAIEAMNGLHDGLRGVMQSVQRAAGVAADKTDEVVNKVEAAGRQQARQQRAMVCLTSVLAIATAVYTAINILVAVEMNRANDIQREMVAATNKAADAANVANDIQREALELTRSAAPPASSGVSTPRNPVHASRAPDDARRH
jgi:hypothetical protein